MTYFKAVRPNGCSFHDPSFRWLPEDGVIPEGGWLVEHPNPAKSLAPSSSTRANRYLSVSIEPADCTGFRWPCRLLVVEPVGSPSKDGEYRNKRRGRAFRVVAEWDSWQALGPNGQQVAALVALLPMLTSKQWAAARDAAWDAADAAVALTVRDLITPEDFATLTAPMRAAGIDSNTLGGAK